MKYTVTQGPEMCFFQSKVEELEQRELEKESDQLDDASRLVETLRRQLAESEASNKNLQSYIDNLKRSYKATFGAFNNASDEEE